MKKILPLLAITLTLMTACTDDSSGSSRATSTSSVGVGSSPSGWVWDGTMVKGKHEAVIKTNKGDITVELDADAAPKTVTNFLALAASGYYKDVTFHRVKPGFMIQGGDPDGKGTGGRSIFGEMFEDEIDAKSALYKTGYKEGVVAMANRGPNTNGSQFFIMDADYELPPSYTIFGHVTKGQEVVGLIARTPRDLSDMPKEKVTFDVQVIK